MWISWNAWTIFMLLNKQKKTEKFKNFVVRIHVQYWAYLIPKAWNMFVARYSGTGFLYQDLASKYSKLWHKHARSLQEYINVMPNLACTQARQNPHLELIEKLEKVWPWCSWLCSSHNSCRCCNWRCHCEHLCQILRTRYTRTRVICYAFLLLSCNVLFVQWTFDLIDWHYTHDLCTFRQKEHSSTARKDST